MTEPRILDLDQILPERPEVHLESGVYQALYGDDLSPLDHAMLRRTRLDDYASHADRLRAQVAIISDIPDRVLESLSPEDLSQLIGFINENQPTVETSENGARSPQSYEDIVPDLQYLYGAADPLVWLRMPISVLNAFAKRMSAIHARETLRMREAVALGSGMFKRADAQRITRGLIRDAGGGQRRTDVIKPKTKQDHQAMLAMAGIRMG